MILLLCFSASYYQDYLQPGNCTLIRLISIKMGKPVRNLLCKQPEEQNWFFFKGTTISEQGKYLGNIRVQHKTYEITIKQNKTL